MLLVQDALKTLMATMSGIASVVSAKDALPHFDFQSPLMSLPRLFATRIEAIPAETPYLRADAEQTARWEKRLGPASQLKVGLVWAGSPREHDRAGNKVDRRRSMTLAQFGPLAAVEGVRFFSLQKGNAAAQAQRPPRGMRLHDHTGQLNDFADTAALVAQLDLVITVDTAVAHLVGAMGRPVWILSRYHGCWRWLLERDDSPWYPTARLFRQSKLGDWASVMATVSTELRDASRGVALADLRAPG